jgi:L-lactate dehydrogenase complex protein LldF
MQTKVAELIDGFKDEAVKAGAVVYEAASSSDACDYVLKLTQQHDIKKAVKSKSKMAEAIKLSQNLEKAGIKVIETDFKDWLAQLTDTKSKRSMTAVKMEKLISRATGQRLDSEPQVLLDAANRTIRQHCISADLGISEADVAIAETGTVVIAGNEGVTRLVAVLPRIHVTLVEPQDIVLKMEDVFTRLVPNTRSGAGHAVPAYVTYITGRNTTADIPGAVLARAQGPAEEHIILLHKVAKRGTA